MHQRLQATYKRIYDWAKQSERPGGEFDWFGVDEAGFVAAFCTAGYGPIPEQVFSAPWETYLKAVSYFEKLHADLQPLHSGGFEPYAIRGLFAYDVKAWTSGEYEREAIPSELLHSSRLPRDVSTFLSELVVPCRFSELPKLLAEQHWKCL